MPSYATRVEINQAAERLVFERFVFGARSDSYDQASIKEALKKHSFAVRGSAKQAERFFWFIDAAQFLDIKQEDDRQKVQGIRNSNQLMKTYFFVRIGKDGHNVFYRVPTASLQEIVLKRYSAKLERAGKSRPKNPDDKHFALYPEYLGPYLIDDV